MEEIEGVVGLDYIERRRSRERGRVGLGGRRSREW